MQSPKNAENVNISRIVRDIFVFQRRITILGNQGNFEPFKILQEILKYGKILNLNMAKY